jgi:aminoglycoside phosphotransferase (APT) family kinase protein
MATDGESQLSEINAWLVRLTGGPVAIAGYEILQGGISGSTVYRLAGGAAPLILKITGRDAPDHVRARAQREIAFYRMLAPTIPLALPRVLALAAGDTGGSAVLLAAYRPPDPPAAWNTSRYLAVAAQLARLHGAFWNRTDRLASLTWLRHPPVGDDPARMQQAQAAWRTLQSRPRFAAILTRPMLAGITRLLDYIPALTAAIQALPATLCHGDCHTGNLLSDASGRLIWADWQEVGIGPGPDDLAFFVQRALMAGSIVPEEPMIARYCREVAAQTGLPLAPAIIRRALAAAELRTRLLDWPDYLGDAAPDQMDAMVRRMDQLAVRLKGSIPQSQVYTG